MSHTVTKKTGQDKLNLDGCLVMENKMIKMVSELKLVGYIYDSALTWGPMIQSLVLKARKRIGAVKHLNRFLNSENMKLVYEMFIRSVMEYGSVAYMGAKPVHLDKLEKVQRIAQRIGNFECDSLSLRREAAAITTTLKLLSGKAHGKLQLLVPELKTVEVSRSAKVEGIQLVSAWKHKYTLDLYRA